MDSVISLLLCTICSGFECHRATIPSLVTDSLSGIVETVASQVTYDGLLQARKSGSKKSKAVNPWPTPSRGFKNPEVELIFLGIGFVVCICMLIFCAANNIP